MRTFFTAMFLLVASPAMAQEAEPPVPETLEAPADTAIPEGMTPEGAAIHNELRALRDRLVAGVNDKDPDAIMADLDDEILFTAMNNEVVHGKKEAMSYYEKMMVGSQRIVKDMSLTVEVDDLAVLLAEGDVAMAAGQSVAFFDMMVGDSFEVPLRWTATLNNTDDGWKVASIHFSANIFDNPLMGGLELFAYAIAGILLILGMIIGVFIGRRRKST